MQTNTESYHCFYYCLQEVINQVSDLEINEAMICFLMNRYGFRYEVSPKSNFIEIDFIEEQLDFSKFRALTGIQVGVLIEDEPDTAWRTTSHTLEIMGVQLVIANTYYLSFDPANYRKSIDEHMIMIHHYDADQETFTVSDYRYKFEKISKEDLMMARSSLDDRFHSFTVAKLLDLPREKLINNVLKSMLSNVNLYLERDFPFIKSLKNELISIPQTGKLFAKLAWTKLPKKLYHPKGPIKSRAMMAQACLLINQELSVAFQELSAKWAALVTEIVRHTEANTDIQNILNKYDDIIHTEYELHIRLKDSLLQCVN